MGSWLVLVFVSRRNFNDIICPLRGRAWLRIPLFFLGGCLGKVLFLEAWPCKNFGLFLGSPSEPGSHLRSKNFRSSMYPAAIRLAGIFCTSEWILNNHKTKCYPKQLLGTLYLAKRIKKNVCTVWFKIRYHSEPLQPAVPCNIVATNVCV